MARAPKKPYIPVKGLPLTKSLHTVTAVKNVAAFLRETNPLVGNDADSIRRALRVLGYEPNNIDPQDDTLLRCYRTIPRK